MLGWVLGGFASLIALVIFLVCWLYRVTGALHREEQQSEAYHESLKAKSNEAEIYAKPRGSKLDIISKL